MVGTLLFVGSAAAAFAGSYLLMGSHRGPTSPERAQGILAGVEQLESLVLESPLARSLRQRQVEANRRAQVLRQVPGMLDVVTLGLSAGLSFDSALDLYCSRYGTELSGALREAMLTWRIGARTRGEALEGLADALGVAALRRFAAAVTQALAFGSPLAAALEQQAQAIRDEQRAELEAEIERVPVKMLIPLGTLIVPAMLLAILGPLLGSSIGI